MHNCGIMEIRKKDQKDCHQIGVKFINDAGLLKRMNKSIGALVVVLYGCTERNLLEEFPELGNKGERESSFISPFIENNQPNVFTFVDKNPSSETYGQKYSFVLKEEEAKQKQYQERRIFFASLDNTTVFNWFEPWCFPCMEELPDLERLALENAIPVFGFTTDYKKFPSINGKVIEDTISYPFFIVDSEHGTYKEFLHQLNPTKELSGEMPEEGVEQFTPTVEMGVVPRTLFIYKEKQYCLRTAGQTYEAMREQTTSDSCPQTILVKI